MTSLAIVGIILLVFAVAVAVFWPEPKRQLARIPANVDRHLLAEWHRQQAAWFENNMRD